MIIYKILCTKNNKCYIGQTKQRGIRRWWQHKTLLRKGKHSNPYLQRSWNKYGEEAFEFEVIKECESLHELNEQEESLIQKNKTHIHQNGFNIRKGGNNTPIPLEVKMDQGTPVIAYGLNGEFKKKYYSISQASTETNADRKGITNCLKGKQQTSGNLQWMLYSKNYPKKIKPNDGWRLNTGKTKQTPVKISNDMETKEFNSIKDAANYIGCSQTLIGAVIDDNRRNQTAFGYDIIKIKARQKGYGRY